VGPSHRGSPKKNVQCVDGILPDSRWISSRQISSLSFLTHSSQEPQQKTCEGSHLRILRQLLCFSLLDTANNSLLSGLLKKIVHADIALGATYRKYWTAEFIEACEGLRAADTYANCIKAATPLPL